MTDSNVFKLSQPGTFTDLLTEVLRNGAHALLVQAVETEATVFLETYAGLKSKRHLNTPELDLVARVVGVIASPDI